jgi:hypothetical protein
MNPLEQHCLALTRRQLLSQAGLGVGAAALTALLGGDALGAPAERGLASLPHFAPKAKRIIYMMQSGAPSQVDLFDYKPLLAERRGQEIPESVHKGQKVSTMTAGQSKKCLGAIAPMRRRGKSGHWISDYLPFTAQIADELCMIKSMKTESVNHAPAMTQLLTGAEQPGRPSMGAWLAYGLGSANDSLPTFCVMTSLDQEGTCGQLFFDYYWGSGFLPGKYQGVKFRGGGDPVLYLTDPPGISRAARRDLLDGLARMNELKHEEVGDPEIETRIAQYEMAFRMQASVPALTDFSTESQQTLAMYGPHVNRRGSYAYNCLMARRLAEQGVRFIQLMHAGWDQHKNLPTQLIAQCRETDQPSAALVADLRQRGLLDDTLILWGGEFGRTPFGQGDINNKTTHGRDHHPYCFTMWAAGGGIKGGYAHGETDEYGYNIVQDTVHVRDFQATVLHLLGIDHQRFTHRFQGLDFRLTGVEEAHVVKSLLA